MDGIENVRSQAKESVPLCNSVAQPELGSVENRIDTRKGAWAALFWMWAYLGGMILLAATFLWLVFGRR